MHYNCLYTLILQCVAYIENTTRKAVQLRGATPHHHPLPVEGRPQPTCLRSVARTARKPPRPARKAPLTAMPAAPAVYAPRLGPAGSAYVSLPAQVSRLRRLPFAAARTPLRQMGCCSLTLVRGWWWGAGDGQAATRCDPHR